MLPLQLPIHFGLFFLLYFQVNPSCCLTSPTQLCLWALTRSQHEVAWLPPIDRTGLWSWWDIQACNCLIITISGGVFAQQSWVKVVSDSQLTPSRGAKSTAACKWCDKYRNHQICKMLQYRSKSSQQRNPCLEKSGLRSPWFPEIK